MSERKQTWSHYQLPIQGADSPAHAQGFKLGQAHASDNVHDMS
jgi:hypothetical protein